MHTLTANSLTKKYGGRKVTDSVTIGINSGEVVGLLGPNGAGKTTTFYMCVGLVAPDEGEIYIDEQRITKEPVYVRAQLGLGYLPQEPSVFRKLSVRDNVMAILETMDFPSNSDRKYRLDELLSDLGITHIADNISSSLSGG